MYYVYPRVGGCWGVNSDCVWRERYGDVLNVRMERKVGEER